MYLLNAIRANHFEISFAGYLLLFYLEYLSRDVCGTCAVMNIHC